MADKGIFLELFDGEIDHLKKLLELFYHSDDNRACITVDAVAVPPLVTVFHDGQVHGLLNTHLISNEDSLTIRSSPEAYHEFLEQHIHELITYCFVFYLCPMNKKKVSQFVLFLIIKVMQMNLLHLNSKIF